MRPPLQKQDYNSNKYSTFKPRRYVSSPSTPLLTIHCKSAHSSISAPSPYNFLSYARQDGSRYSTSRTPNEEILINNQRLTTGLNLAASLRACDRNDYWSVPIWPMSFVSIKISMIKRVGSQAGSSHEGDLYMSRQARCWLGPERENSEIAPKFTH